MNKQTEALKIAIELLEDDLLDIAIEMKNEVVSKSWSDLRTIEYYDQIVEYTKQAIQDCKEALEQPQLTAKQKYDKFMEDETEPSALERLRFFCAQAMNGQDWLDVEPFLNALEQPAQEPVPLIKHKNGNFSPAPSWQGLSDDDMEKAKFYDESFYNGARWAEQALKEKNT